MPDTLNVRLQKNGRFARTLVKTCRHIGEADGNYMVEEQSALLQICRQLRIEPVEAGAIATEIATGLNAT